MSRRERGVTAPMTSRSKGSGPKSKAAVTLEDWAGTRKRPDCHGNPVERYRDIG